MIVESGLPLLLHISEVHHEQLSVQRIRQQQLDLDHPHRSAVPLLRRLRLLIPLKGRPAFGQVATFLHHAQIHLPLFGYFFHHFEKKPRKTRCIFLQNVV